MSGMTRRRVLAWTPAHAGAPAVRIRFAWVEGRVRSLAVHDPDVVLTARRA